MEYRHETSPGNNSIENVQVLIEMNGPQEFLDRGKAKVFERESLTSLVFTVAEVIVEQLDDKNNSYKDQALKEFHNSLAFGCQTLPVAGEATDEAVKSLKDDIELILSSDADDSADQLGSLLRMSWIKFNATSRLIGSYFEYYEPSPLHTNYTYMGFGLATEIRARADKLQYVKASVESLLPDVDYSGDMDKPNADSLDPMDRRIWELTDEQAEIMKLEQTEEEWRAHILKDGSLKTIYKELDRALEDSELTENEDESVILSAHLLHGLAYGLALGSRHWDTGFIGSEKSEVIKLRMKTAEFFSEIGMIGEPEHRWERYDAIATSFYGEYVDDIFEDIVTYAHENIYLEKYRDVFTTAAGIAMSLYNDAQKLRQFEKEFYVSNEQPNPEITD